MCFDPSQAQYLDVLGFFPKSDYPKSSQTQLTHWEIIQKPNTGVGLSVKPPAPHADSLDGMYLLVLL